MPAMFTSFAGRLVGAAAGLAALLAPGAGQAQSPVPPNPLVNGVGQVFSFRVPVYDTASGANGAEAVRFTGVGTITSRLDLSRETGEPVLIATFDFNGIVGVGRSSGTRYVLTAREAMMLPHAPVQSVSLTFPMEPEPGSPLQDVRSGLADVRFAVNMATGQIMAITSSRMGLL